jgi:hypothetical protein
MNAKRAQPGSREHVHPESVAGLSHYKGGSVDKAAASMQEETRNKYALVCLLIRMNMHVMHGTPLPDDVADLVKNGETNSNQTKGFKVVI